MGPRGGNGFWRNFAAVAPRKDASPAGGNAGRAPYSPAVGKRLLVLLGRAALDLGDRGLVALALGRQQDGRPGFEILEVRHLVVAGEGELGVLLQGVGDVLLRVLLAGRDRDRAL